MGLTTEAIGRVVRFPLRVVGGGIEGACRGFTTSSPGSLTIPSDVIEPEGYVVMNWLKNFVGGARQDIATSGLLDAYTNKEFSKMWGILTGAVGKGVGVRGLGMLGIYGVLAGVALYWGTNLALTSWHKIGEIKKGYNGDIVRSPWVHGAHAMTGLAMAGGTLMLLNPVTYAAAAPTIAAGFVGATALHVLRYALGGIHWFRFDQAAPWPLNTLFRKFKNDMIDYNG